MHKKYIGPASLLTIGILFGLSGVIAKYLSQWLNAYQVVEYRFFVALVGALIILLVSRQKLSFSKIDRKSLLLFTTTFPASVIFFTLAIFNTSVSLAVFSFYIATLVSSFIVGRIYFKETISLNKQIALIFILFAIVCFTNPFKDFTIQLGFLFGIVSGILQTIASSFQKILGQSTNRIGLILLQTLTGVLIASFVLLIKGTPLIVITTPFATLTIVIFGLIFLVISYLFLVGFKYTELNVGSVLVSSELFFGPLFALLLLSEGISGLEIIGGVCTAVAVVLANRK